MSAPWHNQSSSTLAGVGHAVDQLEEKVDERLGGPARRKVILLLACVLGLDTADKATVAAIAGQLKHAFDIGNTQIGILVAVTSLTGAVFTLPVGVLVDRVRRTNVISVAMVLWVIAMVVSATATSFLYLLLVRVFLGAVTAAAGPTVASLTGDFFPARERARIYGFILAGELVGSGFGFIVSGEVSSFLPWQAAFLAMAIPGAVLAWVVWRHLPEPGRCGQSWLQPGQQEVQSVEDVAGSDDTPAGTEPAGEDMADEQELAQEQVRAQDVQPYPDLILTSDPTQRGLWWAVRYVLRVRTNVLLIVASALGYFFFSGIRSFAIEYVTGHYGIPHSVASVLVVVIGVGAVAGVFAGGRLSDRWLGNGRVDARIVIPGVALAVTAVLLAPAIWVSAIAIALPLFTIGAAFLAAANAPLDAARLDIMHPRLWGRAEGVRTSVRTTLEAVAPALFGWLSQHVFGGGSHGLQLTFLLMLVPVLVASVLTVPAMRRYPRDVATAAESRDNA